MPSKSRLWACVIVLAGIAAYVNSVSAPFVFDDYNSIVENPHIRRLWPPTGWLQAPPEWTVPPRPTLQLTLALNYAVGQLDPRGYHVVNIAIHLLAGVLLFGLLRRLLARADPDARAQDEATGLAGAAALLWTVHPFQTESVTYIIQRTESLAALCALFVLYGLLRAAEGPSARRWGLAAILTCAAGMASKPVMATAPIAACLLDRAVLAGSWKEVWRRRGWLHAGLMATWLVLIGCLASGPPPEHPSAGLGLTTMTPLEYAMTQPAVILRYLRLAVWPSPLVLDYAWPITRDPRLALWPAAALIALFGVAAAAVRRRAALGFLVAWIALSLAPSSSLIPIADAYAEHRMYLPLAGVLALAVVGGWRLLCRLPFSAPLRRRVTMGLLAAATTALAAATIARNAEYQDEITLWSGVLAVRPLNARAHSSLGLALADAGKTEEAIAHYRRAIELQPATVRTRNNLGLALARQGKAEEAIAQYRTALSLDPHSEVAHLNLGAALAVQGQLAEAEEQFVAAVALRPDDQLAQADLKRVRAERGTR